jgi:hypothetical protein
MARDPCLLERRLSRALPEENSSGGLHAVMYQSLYQAENRELSLNVTDRDNLEPLGDLSFDQENACGGLYRHRIKYLGNPCS